MTEKKVTEAEKAELRDMMAKATSPCPFKIGDIVVCSVADRGGYFSGPKLGKPAVVIKLRQPSDDRGWTTIDDMAILFRAIDADADEGWRWETVTVESWRYRRAG